MKLLMISEYFPPAEKGGGELSAYLLARELVKKKIEVHVLTSVFEGLSREEKKDGIKIHRMLNTGQNPALLSGNLTRFLSFENSLLKELSLLNNKERFDIIHCTNTSSIAAVKLKEKIKKKFVLHVNGPVLFCPKGTLMYKDREICEIDCTRLSFLDCFLHSKHIGKIEMRLYLKYNPAFMMAIRKSYEDRQKLIKKFDYYFPISTFMKKKLIESDIPENMISIVYNISDLNAFLKSKQKKNKIPKLLYLGEYSKPKGPQIFLEALAGITEPYEANFYGSGTLKEYMKELSEKYGLKASINEKLSYDLVPKIMEEHDIVVFPSFVGEAFGRVALEAVSSGKIVVASKIGGITDIIEDSKTGFLFEAGNSKQLRDILEKLLTKKLLINTEKARSIVKEKFSNEKTLKQIIKTYKLLTAEH